MKREEVSLLGQVVLVNDAQQYDPTLQLQVHNDAQGLWPWARPC
jgi:hypothetical protein